MKELCVWLTILAVSALITSYVYQIRKSWYARKTAGRRINPTLSTWIIFFLGTWLSFVTYLIAGKFDLSSGILNTMDVISITAILTAAIVWGERGLRFKPFEKWYLVGVAMTVAYGVKTGDAWNSNLFAQGLIAIGYFPTVQKMLGEKRHTESFTMWGIALLAGFIGLYPAVVDGNPLAILYAVRTIVFVSFILGLMSYYELRSKRTRP
jgi:hypothetical protein